MSTLRDETGLAPQSLVQIDPAEKATSFDARHPPEAAVMDKCVHCGFCLPACPTYVLWGDEMDSPRGRIWMMRKGLLGEAPLDQTFQTHMDNCLGCMACMTACPSGVEYNKLIEDTRAQVERNTDRSIAEKLFRKLLFVTFPYPQRLKLLALPLGLYQRSGLQRVIRSSGILRVLPKRLQSMEELLPQVPRRNAHGYPQDTAARTAKRARVAVLTGCVQDAFFSHVNAATIRVLAAEGFDVVVPPSQGCCGALMVHSGLDDDAAAMARRTIEQFEAADVDAIVINAAGCGSTMKEYGHLLREDPQWAARAAAFSAKCVDVSEMLAAHELRSSLQPLPLRVAYQDACHLRHAQAIFEQPREVLRRIPQLDVAEIAEANLCCGSAGVYNLLHPETAQELGDRKAAHLIDAKAQAIVSANPGCLLQISSALRRAGYAELPAFHMIELLDAAMRGFGADQVLRGESRSNSVQ